MRSNWKVGGALLALGLLVGLTLALWATRPVVGAQDKMTGGGRYTVVATDGTHLVVTDNKDNKVYFYAVDKDGKPGDELKFRGTINLNDVGKAGITPTKPK